MLNPTSSHNPAAQRAGIFMKKGCCRSTGPPGAPGLDGVVECQANPDASMQDVNPRDSNAQRSFREAISIFNNTLGTPPSTKPQHTEGVCTRCCKARPNPLERILFSSPGRRENQGWWRRWRRWVWGGDIMKQRHESLKSVLSVALRDTPT